MGNDISKKKGFIRFFFAFRYSVNGLQEALRNEAAFRQEVLLFLLFLPVIFYLPVTQSLKSILLIGNTLVLIIELLNSAIEAIVDLTSPQYHDLAKRAKDMGSAAVMVSISLAITLWGYIVLTCIFK